MVVFRQCWYYCGWKWKEVENSSLGSRQVKGRLFSVILSHHLAVFHLRVSLKAAVVVVNRFSEAGSFLISVYRNYSRDQDTLPWIVFKLLQLVESVRENLFGGKIDLVAFRGSSLFGAIWNVCSFLLLCDNGSVSGKCWEFPFEALLHTNCAFRQFDSGCMIVSFVQLHSEWSTSSVTVGLKRMEWFTPRDWIVLWRR